MKRNFYVSALIYFLGACIIFPFIKNYADNPDTFQYLDIAKKYLSGDWQNVVNGYWSPMISWLLALPLSVFKDELLAFKILQLLIGFFTLYQWSKLVEIFSLDYSLKKALFFFPIPFILEYALLNQSPDLLFLSLLLMLLNFFCKGNLFTSRKNSLRIAFTGAALFFTKAFGFPFFIAFVSYFLAVQLFNAENKKEVLKHAATLFIAFLILAFCWIVPLSLHYNKFTISEAANFNMSIDAAPLPERGNELPVLSKGLFEPEGNNTSAWATPGAYVSKETINPFQSLSRYCQIVKRNILSIYYYDFRNQAGILFLLLFIFFLIRGGRQEFSKNKAVKIVLFFMLLLYGGYALILVHSRYVWINTWLMVLVSAWFIQQSLSTQKLKFTGLFLFYLIFAVAVKRPFKTIFFTEDADYPLLWIGQAIKHPFTTLWINYKPDKVLNEDVQLVRNKGFLKGNLASLKTLSSARDPYTLSLRIARATQCRYFGQLDAALSKEEQLSELKKMKIDYILAFNFEEWNSGQPVYFNPETGLSIYPIH